MEKIRVLVVDDSAFMRRIISEMILSQPDMEVAGTARDGAEGLEKAASLHPDVVTLDVEMPRMDGLTALSRLMEENPRPVVMVSSLTQANAEATVRALAMGAVDFVPKPSGAISLDMHRQREELLCKVRAAARVPRDRLLRFARGGPGRGRPHATLAGVTRAAADVPPAAGRKYPGGLTRVVVIGSSTGGPSALMEVVPRLSADFPAGLLLVQHMPAGFTRSLAQHLDQMSALPVREAAPGDVLCDGSCLVAPGGYHLILHRDATVSLDDGPPQHGVRPAVDVTLESVADTWGPGAVVAILTGMGFDGARGALKIKRSGGQVLAQDEASCVVYGMPRAVVEIGAADRVVPLGEIADTLSRLVAQPVCR